MNARVMVGVVTAIAILTAGAVHADVFNMGGTREPLTGQWTGLASLETVPVGNPRNPSELSGHSKPGEYFAGPERYCGAVSYGYSIGKYEVTAGQYCEFLNAVATTDTYGLYNVFMDLAVNKYACCNIKQTGSPGSYTYSVPPDYANRPVNYVSWGDAARFCNWLHNGQPTGAQDLTTTEDGAYFLNGLTTDPELLGVTRKAGAIWAIPSEDEWYKAAYYNPATGSYYDYPTSSNMVPGKDLADVSGNNANYSNNAPVDSGKYYTTMGGQFWNSDSPYGTFDQGGNVSEWYEAPLYGPYRSVRGSDFADGSLWLHAEARGNCCVFSTSWSANTGFRVVQVPEPATLSMLALGGLVMLKQRRK